jgi:hypothetical protein
MAAEPETIAKAPSFANLDFVEKLYFDYLADPASVDPTWRSYFEGLPRVPPPPEGPFPPRAAAPAAAPQYAPAAAPEPVAPTNPTLPTMQVLPTMPPEPPTAQIPTQSFGGGGGYTAPTPPQQMPVAPTAPPRSAGPQLDWGAIVAELQAMAEDALGNRARKVKDILGAADPSLAGIEAAIDQIPSISLLFVDSSRLEQLAQEMRARLKSHL